jgi:tetratricopeptide (TPR) repeat protein
LKDCAKKILIICACLFLVSCAARQPIMIPPDESVPESSRNDVTEEDSTVYPPEPEEAIPAPSPRDLAGRNLMDQAVKLLDDNKPDESIRTLERAINISPGRGEIRYYLAEAWYMKGNLAQARENNSLAAIYLKDDPKWMNLIEEQKRRIEDSR